jgi:3-hydroxyisobutyrate dehydrogenase-like beta-hydroxyacid dehydrogenase
MSDAIGFVGLGNMGRELAANLVQSGHQVVAHDLAGPDRTPEGAEFVDGVAPLARATRVVVLSLPDGPAGQSVARAIVEAPTGRVRHVVDTSTVGVDASRATASLLAEAGIGYIDAPVSGGVAGARARTLAVMYAGSDPDCEAVHDVLQGLSDRRFRVGSEPGMAQAVKLANNFLSATALAATSEAVAFATASGVDMATLLRVLNASSGQSAASSDKFVNHVLNGQYASGFLNTLMAKDLSLYLDAVESQLSPATVARVTADIWARFAAADPGVDFTRIYPFTAG